MYVRAQVLGYESRPNFMIRTEPGYVCGYTNPDTVIRPDTIRIKIRVKNPDQSMMDSYPDIIRIQIRVKNPDYIKSGYKIRTP